MAVARVTEISSTSTQGFEDAVRQGLSRATQTLRNVTAAWIKEQRVRLEDGKIVEYSGQHADHLHPRQTRGGPPRASSAGRRRLRRTTARHDRPATGEEGPPLFDWPWPGGGTPSHRIYRRQLVHIIDGTLEAAQLLAQKVNAVG